MSHGDTLVGGIDMARRVVKLALLFVFIVLVIAMLISGATSYINLECLLTGHNWEVIESKRCHFCNGTGYIEDPATPGKLIKCACFDGISEYKSKCSRCGKIRSVSAHRSLRGIIKEPEPDF